MLINESLMGTHLRRDADGKAYMMIPKTKTIKLTGKQLKKLNDHISERENHECALCGAYVEEGVKAHHEPQGALKSDEEDKMLLLCMKCHYKRHNTPEGEAIKAKCKEYLSNLEEGGSK